MRLKRIAASLTFIVIAYITPFFPRSGTVGGTSFSQRSAGRDRQSLIDLENVWLTANDAQTLDRILAFDFVHPVPTGDFLTKAQHIEWFTKHPSPTNLKFRFDRLDIRLYGDVGIANGVVVTSDDNGKEIGRNVFTDVFAYRNGRWQAINGQETDVRKMR